MEPVPAPSIGFEVRVGSGGWPQLFVTAGDRCIPIDVTLEQAASLGVALISASALFNASQTPPQPGETITAVNLPVIGWQPGKNERNGFPAVQMTVLGGATFVLQFTRTSVATCARVLQSLANETAMHAGEADPNADIGER